MNENNISKFVNKIIQGDALKELKQFPDESIDCIITSPPYWSLRDYGEETNVTWGGNSGYWYGQLGLEPTFDLYIKHLCDIFDDVKRVLKKTGTCWVNMGDSYATSQAGNKYWGNGVGSNKYYESGDIKLNKRPKIDYPQKSLCLIPQRFAISMVDRGWILRNQIIWFKRNCMPASVKDRFTVDYEPIFFFVKSNDTQYWVNEKTGAITDKQPLGTKGIEGIDWDWREVPDFTKEREIEGQFGKVAQRVGIKGGGHYDYGGIHSPFSITKGKVNELLTKLKKVSNWSGRDYWFEQQYEPIKSFDDARVDMGREEHIGKSAQKEFGCNATVIHSYGRNRRCVWDIPTKPFKGSHFAVFPETLVEPMIKAGCPEFVCKKCGKAREKIIKSEYVGDSTKRGGHIVGNGEGSQGNVYNVPRESAKKEILGYTDCGCNAGFESGIVLDPFCGAGTTCVVAKKLGRNYVGIDLNEDYCEMSRNRLRTVRFGEGMKERDGTAKKIGLSNLSKIKPIDEYGGD